MPALPNLLDYLPPPPQRIHLLSGNAETAPALTASGYTLVDADSACDVLVSCALAVDFATLRRLASTAGLVIIQTDAAPQQVEKHLAEYGFFVLAYDSPEAGLHCWQLRADSISICGYRAGDEQHLLETFCKVFHTQRSPQHWRWKYLESPFGGPDMGNAWHQDELLAHYAAYPLPLAQDGQSQTIYHAGDTFTVPAWRGKGRGPTSLLSRVFRYHETQYFQRRCVFAYGFNTGKILRFGGLFLGYTAAAPVYDWALSDFSTLPDYNTWQRRGSGYHISVTEQPSPLFDKLFAKARGDYPWLVERSQAYLRWRYEQCPDDRYTFFLVQRWGRPLGWWLVRLRDQTVQIGDALFIRHRAQDAARLGLAGILHHYRSQAHEIDEVRGWFAAVPTWWPETLASLGFARQRQFQDLHLCVKSYTEGLSAETIAANFYFTWGDGDLY